MQLKSENHYKQSIYGNIQFMLKPLQHEKWGYVFWQVLQIERL